MDTIKKISVSTDGEGARADRFLADQFPDLSRTRIKELISEGRVTSCGALLKAGLRLRAGQEIEVVVPAPQEPGIVPQEMPLDILYEDGDLLIVNKPRGLTVHPAPGHPDGTLVNGLMAHCGSHLSGINGVLRPGIVHRIDKDTSGALIVCKNDTTHRDIAAQLSAHSITRLYRGVVLGRIAEDSLTIEGNIGRSQRDRKKMAVVPAGQGKRAVTHVRVLARFEKYTYCEFSLETGRTHQIRVHMAKKGHPLLGDAVYGPEKNEFGIKGQVLHAMVIGFIHPATGKYVEFTAPLPEYFEDILDTLKKRNA